MERLLSINCPVCQNLDNETIHTINCGNLDNSQLYPTVRLKCCSTCNHIFNELSEKEIMGLTHYYNFEYIPSNMSSPEKQVDRPGSTNNLTTDRYSKLYDFLFPHIQIDYKILDVGCAMGGFLDFLNQKGYKQLYGVDMAEKYTKYTHDNSKYKIKLGNAEALPFDNHSIDVIVIEQVLEHLVNPSNAFKEAKRVLKNNGIFCIGVPDASRYNDFYFFDFYWLLLREHIQHFDIQRLNLLAQRNDFKLLDFRKTINTVLGDKLIMPNLFAAFKLSNNHTNKNEKKIANFDLKKYMKDYITKDTNRQLINISKFEELSKTRKQIYAWGIGREFLYLYESIGLKKCNIVGLIDSNQFKQTECSVDENKIQKSTELIPLSTPGSTLLITAIAHTNSIKNESLKLGFKGDFFEL